MGSFCQDKASKHKINNGTKHVVPNCTTPELKYSLTTYTQYADGEELYNIDRLNLVCRIDGQDYLEDIRNQIQ